MAFVGSASVASSSDAVTLTFTDASTGISGLVSRQLVVSDSNGVVVSTQNMGAALTATVTITTDVYYAFVETIVDANGPHVVTVDFESIQFYNLAQAALAAALVAPCGCNNDLATSLVIARESINAALTFGLIGDGQSAQLALTNADYYINNPTY